MLAEQIINYIREEYSKGRTTQQEIATALNVDHQTINRLLSGKRSADGLTVGTFDKMFPKAKIDLTGTNAVISAPSNSGNVVGVNNGNISADCLSGVMNKILSTEELTAEEKVKVLKVLQK